MGMTRADADPEPVPEPVPEPEPEAEPESLAESKPESEADAQYYAGGGGFNPFYNPGVASPCAGGNCLQASAPCYGGNCGQASAPCMSGNCLPQVAAEWPVMPAMPIVQSMPAVQTSNNVCGMTDKCCGMAAQDCCLGGEQKCYTVYDRVCDGQDSKPVCTVRSERDCHNIQVPLSG